jgi:hypothetical protein
MTDMTDKALQVRGEKRMAGMLYQNIYATNVQLAV